MMGAMHMSSRWWWVAMVLLGGVAMVPHAQAQDPDVRTLQPVVMIVLDTSGSMEGVMGAKTGCEVNGFDGIGPADRPGCPGNPTSNLCNECYPNCSNPPGTAGDERNRWATAVETLTGTFTNFECTEFNRNTPSFTYDRGYLAPHHALAPAAKTCAVDADCAGSLFARTCVAGACTGTLPQAPDGVLKRYETEVRFGLMTFDTIGTYSGSSQLIPDYEFLTSRSEAVDGMYSYGGAQPFTYPNCLNTYLMDTGVRRPAQGVLIEPDFEGSLISAGNGTAVLATNQRIKDALLSIRPFGGTPIAAALSDLDFYFRNDPDMTADAYDECRARYGILITDGKPDDDFRQFGCDQPGFTCPYPLPEDQAGILRCGPSDPTCGSGGDLGTLEKLFVVGLDVDTDTNDPVHQHLNLIAERGGNTVAANGTDYAVFASTAADVTTALSTILDSVQSFPVSRTTPLVVRSKNGHTYRISAAFERPGNSASWSGVLERQPLACATESGGPPDPALTDADKFDIVLTATGDNTRNIFTVLPLGGVLPTGPISKSAGTTGCPLTTTGCLLSPVGHCDSVAVAGCTATAIDETVTGSVPADFGALIDWVHGNSGSDRASAKLGGIYHSSPAYADAMQFDHSDASFNLFRIQEQAQNGGLARDEVIYTSSTDGQLHAFALEGVTVGGTYPPVGKELWAFIPPMLLDDLEAAKLAPNNLLDGTPVVRNIFTRLPGDAADPTQYRTVVVAGMRQGGRGYFALDVTNPKDPKFLWQFTDANMGDTYGRPAIAQIEANFGQTGAAVPGVTTSLSQRAVALLPGGTGVSAAGLCTSARDSGGSRFSTYLNNGAGGAALVAGPQHRAQHRCWPSDRGRAMHFVDVMTGHPIAVLPANLGPGKFTSPLVGTPAVFNGKEGALATRAFVSDADGVLWRVDFSKSDPTLWDAAPFHDMGWELPNADLDKGQPGFEPPILSIDAQDRVVVLYGQGNLDNFENLTAFNRVVSLTEIDTNPALASVERVKAGFNWEFKLPLGELVTGPPVLINSVMMFATFNPANGSGNACDPGSSRLWAIEYVAPGATPNAGAPGTPSPGFLPQFDDFNIPHTDPPSLLLDEKLVMGLSVTQREVCESTAVTGVAPSGWSGAGPTNVAVGPPVYQVVANTATGNPASGGRVGSIVRQVTLSARSRVVSWAGPSE